MSGLLPRVIWMSRSEWAVMYEWSRCRHTTPLIYDYEWSRWVESYDDSVWLMHITHTAHLYDSCLTTRWETRSYVTLSPIIHVCYICVATHAYDSYGSFVRLMSDDSLIDSLIHDINRSQQTLFICVKRRKDSYICVKRRNDSYICVTWEINKRYSYVVGICHICVTTRHTTPLIYDYVITHTWHQQKSTNVIHVCHIYVTYATYVWHTRSLESLIDTYVLHLLFIYVTHSHICDIYELHM